MTIINAKGSQNRYIRQKLSNLSLQGDIYIPIGDFQYKHISECTQEQIDKFLWSQIKAQVTRWNNKIKPIQKYLNQEMKDYLYDGGLFKKGE